MSRHAKTSVALLATSARRRHIEQSSPCRRSAKGQSRAEAPILKSPRSWWCGDARRWPRSRSTAATPSGARSARGQGAPGAPRGGGDGGDVDVGRPAPARRQSPAARAPPTGPALRWWRSSSSSSSSSDRGAAGPHLANGSGHTGWSLLWPTSRRDNRQEAHQHSQCLGQRYDRYMYP